MRSFDEIFAIAADRKGGPDALEALLSKPQTAEALAAIPDDRWLAKLTQMVFSAGFNWKVIEAKWPGFEEAFKGFDVGRCAFMDDEWFDSLLTDTRIVRNGTKIKSVPENAAFLLELQKEHGSAARVLADWPSEDYIGLLSMLKSRGSRLGGSTAQYFLRFMGKDSFVLSADVVARLVAEDVVDKTPTSKKALAATQAAFNEWAAQSGRSLTEISRVLAMSVG
ncbi:DNA-3-methyladenine glycosylase I [Pseudohalocynthiibacter aestuariivivens]|jgi:3-methyladenine DNA glycosylase Tag|uniref:DNA-3-methyladenine glycosylase I n=1 Tax=Pseudohalocynthiibacter aestuariivivens TaxID=1591409 RepID=A0ABV5JDX2_9RHOB|nr:MULTISPECIES: DNA-3-methyladenine glycosylase I [Pseudohalocynthiibacter]MBS9718046.1 DNA-3-methyladenine glycosylase I [Pseudohalocynthiibacter aestuariivivens]MCK0103257.1 DNA-3-methyladenine glycosylase I [Pseudohalocynthiibacter sp. F2068]